MRLHEYQAKSLLERYGVPIPPGRVASTPDEAEAIARELGGRVVVKAQVHAGGRGRAGGVRLVDTPAEAGQVAESLLGRRLVTQQTGPEGVPVDRVLVARATDIARELYVSITVDRAYGGPVVIATAEGGMEVEEVAERFPDRIHKEGVDLALGLMPFQARRVAYFLGLEGAQVSAFGRILSGMYRLFVEQDCSLVEVNPLAVLPDGSLTALDAKVNLEDDALFRHGDLREWYDPGQEDELERRAHEHGIAYVRLDGDVGCLVNGAGLAMATLDVVLGVGARPANFLDVGGGADPEKVAQAFDIILSDTRVRRILVNVFGGILRCDVVAEGILTASQGKKVPPMVVRMQGTNVEEGRRLLEESALEVTLADSLAEAAEKVKALSTGAG